VGLAVLSNTRIERPPAKRVLGIALAPVIHVELSEMKKQYYEQSNIGHAKYVVNYHDGIQTHRDGSPFFGIAIFRNKVKKDAFIKNLSAQGYAEKTK
jgi:hypothetical protein